MDTKEALTQSCMSSLLSSSSMTIYTTGLTTSLFLFLKHSRSVVVLNIRFRCMWRAICLENLTPMSHIPYNLVISAHLLIGAYWLADQQP